jgi:hypothetical protein
MNFSLDGVFVKINDNGSIQYPYTKRNLQNDNPTVSFPTLLDQNTLDAFRLSPVRIVSAPEVGYSETVREGPVRNNNGTWEQTWEVTKKSSSEIASIAKQLRGDAYRTESDPLFFKWQRDEVSEQDWLDKVNEIKRRYPEGL